MQPIPVVSNLRGCQSICIQISLSGKTEVQTAICQYHRHRRQRRDADNVPRLRLYKGMAHRNPPQTYFMCISKNFRREHRRMCVRMGEVVHQSKQTVEEVLKTFLRWGGILSPQLILPYGSQRGCCYPPECLQFQNLLFQFLPRHHHYLLLERLWTPVTEKVTLLMSYDFCFSLMIVLVST